MNSSFEISSPHSVNLSNFFKERPLEISITFIFLFLSKSLGEARPAQNLELIIIIEKKNFFTKEKTKERKPLHFKETLKTLHQKFSRNYSCEFNPF